MHIPRKLSPGPLLRLALAAALLGPAAAYEVKPITKEQAAEYKLDPGEEGPLHPGRPR